MRASERTYYNIKRLHLWMAVSSLALLGVTVWMLMADHNRQWKRYQRTFQDRIQPWMTEARIRLEESRESPDQSEISRLKRLLNRQQPTLGKRLLRLPLIDALGRPLEIEQIWLPELTIDYNFSRVARFDRCTTCHQGIDMTVPEHLSHPDFPGGLPHPYRSHPRLELFVGSRSPHPMTEFGCTICHDGQGSATEFKWASHAPDDPAQEEKWREQHGWFHNPHWAFPMLPKRFSQSRCLKCHHEVTDLEPGRRWPDPPAEKLLAGYHLVRQNGCFGCHEIRGFDESGRSIGPDMRLEPNDPEAASGPTPPGTMHKVGPSLHGLAGRLEATFLTHWIRNPADFRPKTRMPRFYGLHEHLKKAKLREKLREAERFEAVEIRAIAAYLLSASQPVEPQPSPPEVTEPPDVERGRRLFVIHGCLACHQHEDFPEGRSIQGPDLSRLGSKYRGRSGQAWLTSWIRDPARHSPRTLMPNSLLEPAALRGEDGGTDAAPGITDPAADIAAYLLDSDPWRPRAPLPFDEVALDELAALYLSKADRDALESLDEMTVEQKLREVGRRTIGRRGCYGCHDIPGFEDAQPIGPALTDWGRKEGSLLAFEQINQLIDQPDARVAAADPDRAFFINALRSHRREGFIWQKLRAPRSFDFKTAAGKDYDEWLTMGRFEFTEAEREAIITFVLGLVAEPPAERYVCRPDARGRAIAQGRRVLDKYACAECHVLQMQRWAFEYDPKVFEGPPPAGEDYEFLRPKIPPEQIAASLRTDDRGLGTAEVVGMPRVDAEGKPVIADDDEDEEGNTINQYCFTLWEPAAINGQVWTPGGGDLLLWGPEIIDGRLAAGEVDLSHWGAGLTAIRRPVGGALARLLLPVVLAEARASGSRPLGPEAWGWLPPPLVGEGAKVQPAWLHDFLLAPEPIRPACVLRMPRYSMSPEEAGKLADYFAAVAGVDFPYSSHPRSRSAHRERMERQRPGRLDDAMKLLVASGTDCVKCHLIGDYSPGGETGPTLAPNLERAGRRIRPEYLRRWLAHPRTVLPYTPMTVNFPPADPPWEPELFDGNTREQLDAVTDLLLNYDWYLGRKTSIRQLVPPATLTDQDTRRREE